MAEAVKVIVRCRPMNNREKQLNCKEVVKIDTKVAQCGIKNPADAKAPPKNFTFDGAYGTDSTTETIYADIAYPLVEGVTEGYNGTIFAYGQTGCGKSFSMQGITDPATQRGIIPRAFDHIFETITVSEGAKYLVHASYLEIYNEEIRDLLGKDIRTKLELKEHPERGVYVQNLSKHHCKTVRDCNAIMEKGWNNRSTGATLMNAESSRSHSIFTIHMERCDQDGEGEEHIRAGKLNLVDLAGSERQGKTGATGDRLKEATKINLSLSALGNVISALVDGKSKHIPYRDSKLTRLLQDSLGGNTKTLMVACLSPADNNYDETLSTLRYANRAKNIKNKPKINEDPKDAMLREYQEEINRLKMMLRGEIPVDVDGSSGGGAKAPAGKTKVVEKIVKVGSEEVEQEKERVRQEYEDKMAAMQEDYDEMKMSKAVVQEEMAKLREQYDNDMATVEAHVLSPGEQGIPLDKSDSQSGSEDTAQNADLMNMQMKEEELEAKMLQQLEKMENMKMGISDQGGSHSVTENGQQDPALELDPAEADYLATAEQAVHLGTVRKLHKGLKAPRSSPTGEHSMGNEEAMHSNSAKVKSETGALERLAELQQAMVGGEEANNEEKKEKRRKKKRYAEERTSKLKEALADKDGEEIMLDIFDTTQLDLEKQRKLLAKQKQRNEELQTEIQDLQQEFEFDRNDYLDTIRKQTQNIGWLQAVIDRIHPCLRRDCNYINLDKIKIQSSYDEENQEWSLPKMTIEKSKLPGPPGGVGKPDQNARPQNGETHPPNIYDEMRYEDRYLQKLQNSAEQNTAKDYFKSKRTEQLLKNNSAPRGANNISPNGGYPLSNGHSATSNGYPSGYSSGGSTGSLGGGGAWQPEPLQGQDDGFMRKPQRLESLAVPKSGKRSKKKQQQMPQQHYGNNNYDQY